MAETVHLLGVQFTLLLLEAELELVNLVKDKCEMFLMLIHRVTVDK
jgi:hypothetical protein